MTRAKFFILLTVVALWLAVPALLLAQAPPHQFLVVDAKIDGVEAPTNSSIVALIEIQGVTQVVARDQIMGRLSVSNFIRFRVEPPSGQSYVGKLVTFEVNGYQANQSYLWESGGQNRVELTAVSVTPATVVPETSTPTPTNTPEPTLNANAGTNPDANAGTNPDAHAHAHAHAHPNPRSHCHARSYFYSRHNSR